MLTELMPLKTSLAINVLASVLPKAAGRTQAQIRAITRRAVIKADADAAARRRREAVRESRVFVQPEPDGMAKFCGILPATEAMEAYRLVDAHAATYEPDDRTCTRRRHHRAKQTGWTPTPLPDGSILWQSPCGRTYTRPPATDPPEPVDPDATLPPV
jgi:hypothetical protein